jgi:hypothetical protein
MCQLFRYNISQIRENHVTSASIPKCGLLNGIWMTAVGVVLRQCACCTMPILERSDPTGSILVTSERRLCVHNKIEYSPTIPSLRCVQRPGIALTRAAWPGTTGRRSGEYDERCAGIPACAHPHRERKQHPSHRTTARSAPRFPKPCPVAPFVQHYHLLAQNF